MIIRKYTLKNMVSKSCVRLIKLYFKDIEGIDVKSVFLGEANLIYDPSVISEGEIEDHFNEIGFEVVNDEEEVITEQVKAAAIELIMFAANNNSIIRNSDYISDKVQKPYEKISKIFSHKTGITLEKYIILLKIEKAKEMILDGSYNLSEISYQLGYSSVQYLSRQFKQTTGKTFSEFKELEHPAITPLENLI